MKYDRDAQVQIGCVAEKSSGKYYDANSSAELINGITNSVKQALTGKVLSKISVPAKNEIPPDAGQPVVQPTK